MMSEQQCRRNKRQYPPSIPAATLLATDSYPFVKRRIPVAPLIRLSGMDRLSHQQQLYQQSYSTEQQRRPQTPPPAYAGTLPPRYEEVVSSQYSDDDVPLVQIQQEKYFNETLDDEHETLDRVQQRLKLAAYNVTKQQQQ